MAALSAPEQRELSDGTVAVVGAGLGGLSAAAHLARAGRRVHVLERSSFLGGCCSARVVDGIRYDAGANYFGRHLLRVFADLGAPRPFPLRAIQARAVIDGHGITHPFGGYSIREFFDVGLSAFGLLALLFRLYGQLYFNIFRGAASNQEVIDRVARHMLLAEFFNLEAFLLGSRSDWMPAYLFNVIFGTEYGFDQPFYPAGGSQAIPDALVRIIEAHGGEVRTGVAVDAIRVENGAVQGVMCGGELVPAGVVVSTLGAAGTARQLAPSDAPALHQAGARVQRGLEFATLLLALDADAADTPPVHTLVGGTRDLRDVLRRLFEGERPAEMPFVLTSPTAGTPSTGEPRPAVLRFPVPQGTPADPDWLPAAAQEVLDRLYGFVPRLQDRVIRWKLYSPSRFREAFGFDACYSPELETRANGKPDYRTEVRGLYLAGAGVGARGVHTGAAVESGRRCAQAILSGSSSEGGNIRER